MPRVTALLALLLLSSAAFAADPAPAVHWYRIAVTGAGSEKSFTGSSPLDAAHISAQVNGADTIVLENIREVFAQPPALPYGWHPNEDVLKVYIPARSVAYFVELPGDPAAKKP